MSLDPLELDALSRSDLVERARALGAERPDVMTRVELRDEIIRLSEADPAQRRRSRGFLGVARDLVASVVGAGLNMKDAAAVIRGDAAREPDWQGPPPVATLTLAEIYAAQGHWDRALSTLSEVLEREPDHTEALALRERLTRERDQTSHRGRRILDVVEVPPAVAAPRVEPAATAASPVVPPPAEQGLADAIEASVERADTPPDAVVEEVPPHSLGDFPQPPTEMAPEGAVAAAPPHEVRAPEPAAMVAPLSDLLPSLDTPQPVAPERQDGVVEPRAAAAEAAPDTPRVGAAPVPPVVIAMRHDPDEEAALGGAFTVRSHGQGASPYRSGASDCVLFVSDDALEFRFELSVLPAGAVVRLVGFAPGGDGPRQADAPLSSRQGRLSLPGFGQGVVVRAALGIAANASFEPLAVARVYRNVGSSSVLEFLPPGSVAGELDRAS
jgi:hypothetical protein